MYPPSKHFYFSTLFTTLPHDKLKTRLKETIHKAFSHRNDGSKCVVLGYNSTYILNKIQKGKTCYSGEQVNSMLEFLVDNIVVSFGGALFQQVVGIPMGTNRAPLLADLYLCSYQSEFLHNVVKYKKIHEARAFFLLFFLLLSMNQRSKKFTCFCNGIYQNSMYCNRLIISFFFLLHHNIVYSKSPVYTNLNGPGVNIKGPCFT
jgi:hypothetical protein